MFRLKYSLNKCSGEEQKNIQEIDKYYIKKTNINAKYIAEKYDFVTINCSENGKIKSIEQIHHIIREAIENYGI